MSRRSKVKRAILALAVSSAAAVALVGFAHTRWGRPLMGLLRGAPGCPVQTDLDPAELEERRITWGRKLAGSTLSPAQPAMGFALGVSRKAELLATLSARGARCSSTRSETALACTGVRDGLFHDAYFQFDTEGRLVAVDAFREPGSPAEALAWIAEVERELTRRIGPATSSRGERSPEFLGAAPYRQLTLEYRYSDYVGRVAATNLGPRGLRVREQYQWFPAKSGKS